MGQFTQLPALHLYKGNYTPHLYPPPTQPSKNSIQKPGGGIIVY